MAMTQKDFNAAMFLAVTALAKRLTGDDLCITLSCEDGEVRSITGDARFETWLSDEQSKVAREVTREARERPPLVSSQAPCAAK
jgi:hypothetical protein